MEVVLKLKNILNRSGITMVEIIMTLAVLGVVICPLLTMFITSQKISNYCDNEYKSMLLAQKYMEEIESIKELDTENYKFNCDAGFYEREVFQTDSSYVAKIRIMPIRSMLYKIEVDINDINESDKTINKLECSKIFY